MPGKPIPLKRVALVVKRSVLERYLEQPTERMKNLLDKEDPSVANVHDAHTEHIGTVAEVKEALADTGAEVTRIRKFRSGFDASEFDLVVTIGGDGTLLHASKSVGTTPILAVNSAPTHSVGFFCGVRKGQVAKTLRASLRGTVARVVLSRMQVSLNGEPVSTRVLNDALFCHQSPAATSRYLIEHQGITEDHKSSGFWIGPAAGSTAAQRSAGGKVLPLASKNLQLVVREPYTPFGNPYQLQLVCIKPEQILRVRSKSKLMCVYIDGPDLRVRVGLGDVLEFSLSAEPLELLGISARRKWDESGNAAKNGAK